MFKYDLEVGELVLIIFVLISFELMVHVLNSSLCWLLGTFTLSVLVS
jgi:hypothetical protein